MRNYLVGTAMVLGTAALVWAGNAKAEPPAAMTYMTQTPPLLVCDTRAQMDEVIASIKEGKVKEKLAEMQNIKDKHNEAVCLFSPLSGVVFGQSEHLGQMNDRNQTIDVWVSYAGNHNTDFYLLWAEEVQTTGL